METRDETNSSSVESGPPSSESLAAELLRAIAAAAPQLWFPGRHAEATEQPRERFDEPLWALRQAGLIQVADWKAGFGQGFSLTRAGERAVELPEPMSFAADRNSSEETEPIAIRSRRVLVAPLLLAINLVWYLAGGYFAIRAGVAVEYLKGESIPEVMRICERIGAVTGLALLDDEFWRLLTSCFVHIGLFHLLGNMLTLGLLGPIAERFWGRGRFVAIYLLAGLAGSAIAIGIDPTVEVVGQPPKQLLLAGASGSLWGMSLSIILWLLRYRRTLPEGLTTQFLRDLGLMMLLNLFISFAPGISLTAHLGGGIVGALAAIWLDRSARPSRWLSLLGLALIVAIIIGGLGQTMRKSDKWEPLRGIHEVRRALAHFNIDGPPDER